RHGDPDAMRLRRLARTQLRGRHVGTPGGNLAVPERCEDPPQIVGQLLPEAETDDGDVFADELMVLKRMTNAGLPELAARHCFKGCDQAVEGALRERERHVRQWRGIGDRSHEVGPPGLPYSAGVADLQSLEIAESVQLLRGAEPVEEAVVEPRTDDMR